MKNRLSKVLASAGVASRRKAEELIFQGLVKVNGKVILKPEFHVDIDEDRIEVEGQLIKRAEEKVYFLLNKPVGYLCSSVKRVAHAKLVIDLFSHLPYRLFTVGRLDRETAGLIIVTNDGHFAHRIMHPSFEIPKEYLVKTFEEVLPEHLQALSKGGFVEGSFVKPKKVMKVRRGTIKMILTEGRKREVRVLVEKAGLEILSLTRIRIGPLHLGSLSEGYYRPLSKEEVTTLSSSQR